MIQQKLRELGFSEKEVKIYLALLELGSAVASDVAKKAKIKRSTTYVILDLLAERGMTSMVERRGVQLYSAAPPEQLVEYLKSMSSRYAGLADTAKKLLPELKASRKIQIQSAPKVQMFQGLEGIKTVYQDTLASLEEIRVRATFEHDTHVSISQTPHIKMRILTQETVESGKRIAFDKDTLSKALTASRGNDAFASEINIYDNRVIFISKTENFALVIESREFADAMRNTFAASDQQESKQTEKPILRPAFGL